MAASTLDQELQGLIAQVEAMGDLLEDTAVLADWAAHLEQSFMRNFIVNGRYSEPGSFFGGSKKWADLAPSTKADRKRKKYGITNILRRTSYLYRSIGVMVGDGGVVVRVGALYGAMQHFGSKDGKVPARPFIVLQKADLEELLEIGKRRIQQSPDPQQP